MKNLHWSFLFVSMIASSVQAQTPIAQHPEVVGAIKLLEGWIETRMAYRGQPGMLPFQSSQHRGVL